MLHRHHEKRHAHDHADIFHRIHKIRPGASPEAVPVHDHRLEQIRHHPGHHRAHIDASKANILNTNDRQHQIHNALKQGQVFILFKNPRRNLIIQQNDPSAIKIKIN